MKKNFILGCMVLFIACNSNKTNDTAPATAATSSVAENLVYPYSMNYSNFKSDDQKNTQTALKLWKHWDDGDLDKQKEFWADSAEVHTYDGIFIKGSRDSINSSGKNYRSSFNSIVSSVSGVISFTGTNKTTGKEESWAAVWGKRVMVDKTGKADSVFLHDAWRFNEKGLVDILYQFAGKMPAQ
jgi:hypothetical protein